VGGAGAPGAAECSKFGTARSTQIQIGGVPKARLIGWLRFSPALLKS